MDEDKFNMELRKFLKKVGVTSQREIETAVRDKMENGELTGNETLKARMELKVADLDLDLTIDGDINLN